MLIALAKDNTEYYTYVLHNFNLKIVSSQIMSMKSGRILGYFDKTVLT